MRVFNNSMSSYLLQSLKSPGSLVQSSSEESVETVYNRAGVTVKGIGTARSIIKANIYYSLMETSSKAIQASGDKLMKEGETSLFAKAEALEAAAKAESEKTESGQEVTDANKTEGKAEASKDVEKNPYTEEVVDEIKNFISLYNSMIKSLNRTATPTEQGYANEITSYAREFEDDLKAIGIKINRDGSLKADEKVLDKASISELKNVFYGKDSFTNMVTTASMKVESCGTANVNYLNSFTYSSLLKGYNAQGTNYDNFR